MSKSNISLPPDNEQRELILNRLDSNMLVEASAGTGKTTSMVGRMLAMIATGTCKIQTMAAVTFTRKAAAELRGRFQVELEKASRQSEGSQRELFREAVKNLDQCFIGTIHSFCAKVLRERPVEAGVDLGFSEVDDETDSRMRMDAWRECTDQLVHANDEILLRIKEKNLELKDIEGVFLRYAEFSDIDAWPGSDVANNCFDHKAVFAEIKKYVAHMGKLSSLLPRNYGKNDNIVPLYLSLPRVVSHFTDDSPAQVASLLERFEKKGKVVQRDWIATENFTKEQVKDEEERWNLFRETVVLPALLKWRESCYPPVIEICRKAMAFYDEARHAAGLLNYQDLLIKTAALLRGRAHIRKYFAKRFSHLLVDEFQDTDPIQAEIILLLTATDHKEDDWRKCRPREGSLFVVGDPKQSIYRFRRADIETYNEVKNILHPDKDFPPVCLSANFRTHQKIVDWVNSAFIPNTENGATRATAFPAEVSAMSPTYSELACARREGEEGELCGVYSLSIPKELKVKNEICEYEADRIARTIRYFIDSEMTVSRTEKETGSGKSAALRADDFLIVTKTRANMSLYAQKLQQYNVPHVVTGGNSLNEIGELFLLNLCLKAVVYPQNPVALVGALRSELFGISDSALYEFHKSGGEFSYRADVPGAFEHPCREQFEYAYGKLKIYAEWFSRIPPVAATQAIADDLGLIPCAAGRPGGDFAAGGIGKAMEILRSAQAEFWSVAQMLERLDGIVKCEEKHDGISARSSQEPSVRIMNLHKVKGLEAPVVFLASTYGKSKHPVNLHVERSSSGTHGYMAIAKSSAYSQNVFACPPDWGNIAQKESEFLAAEELRLLYVAATRAGSAMIISRQENGKDARNPWRDFVPLIPSENELPQPGEISLADGDCQEITDTEIAVSFSGIEKSRGKIFAPSYNVLAAKSYALSLSTSSDTVEADIVENIPAPESGQNSFSAPGGEKWGTVIHALLDFAANNQTADLGRHARNLLVENGLPESLAQKAIELASRVISSQIMDRARQSEKLLTEVPFALNLQHTEDNPKSIMRGEIDLAFRESGEWVIVDYKTDRAASGKPGEVVKKYAPQIHLYADAWEKVTGEKVKETGLFFTITGEYVIVEREN